MIRCWLIAVMVAVVGVCAPCAQAEDFTPKDVIHPSLAGLKAPSFYPTAGQVIMPIFTSSDLAKKHVLQGVSLINAAWDYEAYRHFCAAIQEDPECLMAYWGASLAMGSGLPEFQDEWAASSQIMLDLMQTRLPDGELKYPEYERDHVAAVAVLLTEGATRAREVYDQLSIRYPADKQSRVMALLMRKAGYDYSGEPRGEQKKAEYASGGLLLDDVDDVTALTAHLLISAEVPNKDERVRKTLLPYARKLVRLSEGFGPHLNLLAFFEWRSGNMQAAEAASSRAQVFFSDYMKASGVQVTDCDKYFIAGIQKVVAQAGQQNYKDALAGAEVLAKRNIPANRATSAGGVISLWDARTLAARLYLQRGQKGDAARALESLPSPDGARVFQGKSLSVHFYQVLANYCELVKALDDGNVTRALILDEAFPTITAELGNKRRVAITLRTMAEWYRALTAAGMLSFEGKGRIAMARGGDKRKSAFNWYSSAADRQRTATMIRPPYILYPLELRLAEYYMEQGDYENAETRVREGLVKFPNDLGCLRLYQDCLVKLERMEHAEAVKEQIALLTGK